MKLPGIIKSVEEKIKDDLIKGADAAIEWIVEIAEKAEKSIEDNPEVEAAVKAAHDAIGNLKTALAKADVVVKKDVAAAVEKAAAEVAASAKPAGQGTTS